MISLMRDYARSLKFVLLIVIVVFILTSGVLFYFGTGPFEGGRGNAVAVVNGEEIPFARFQRTRANIMAAYERMSRQQLTPEIAERLGLSQQVINELVTEAVVVQGATREGITVSHEEISARIREVPAFQVDGRYAPERYLDVLKREGINPDDFYAEVKRVLLRVKMETLVKQGVKVSDEEVRQAYTRRHERVRAAWAYADLKPVMASVQVADADLEPYLKAHQPQFSRPERRRLQYVLVIPKKLGASVSDAEVEAYYKEHAAEFEEPKRLRIAHVLVRVPPVGGSDAENAAKAKVEDVIRRAKGGEDFGKLAREISEDKASAVQGGDLGFVGPGELVAPFEQAAFALQKGEVSAPVRTPFGYHAIRVLDVKEGGTAPLTEVAPRVKEALATQKSEQAARTRAEEARAALLSAKDFSAEAKRLGLEAQEVTFGRGDALGEAGRDPQLDETLFGLAVGGVSTPIETPGGLAIVKVIEHLPAGVPPMTQIRDQVVEAIKRERAVQQVTDKARTLAVTLGEGGDFAAAARTAGFTAGSIPLFSRADPPKERGSLPGSVLTAALQTPAGQIAEPVRAEGGVYVVKTLERMPAAPDGLERERAELEKEVLEQKRGLTWDNWIRGRLADSKVEVGGQPAPLTR